MYKTSTTTLTMRRHFNVPVEKIYEAWLDAKSIRKWLFTMEPTNKVAKNEPHVGGTWEIIDHRQGKDYRAIGEYKELDAPHKIVCTFRMPQFSDTEDMLTVTFQPVQNGCEMMFIQTLVVPHEEGWTEEDIEKAEQEYRDGSEQGWHYMFLSLKQLVETGTIQYPS